MSRQKVMIGVAVVAVSALNFGAGFYAAKRVLEPKYLALTEQEIADAKLFYSKLYKKEEFATPGEIVTAKEIIVEQNYIPKPDLSEEPDDDSSLTDDLVEEIELAIAHGHPHIISQHEYLSNTTEYAQMSLTYFEDDDVLVDSDDTLIDYVADLIGVNNLTRFGVLSGDNTILYVRNPTREIEFEILLNKGNYAKDVLGFIEHSDKVKVRKFRRDYE